MTPKFLKKLKSDHQSPIHYYLRLGDQETLLNQFLGQTLTLSFTGNIFCTQCHKKTTKSFQQGYCYPCFMRLQECQLCMIHPERCLVEEGKCPEDDWAHAHCHQKHIVYLANASGLKVGITRETQAPTRWIDQGAIQALPIFTAENRYQSGLMEVALKDFVADKTNWRNMLKNQVSKIDLIEARDRLWKEADKAITRVLKNKKVTKLTEATKEFHYPVLEFPTKVTALSLDKTPEVRGKLLGIKGQYLIMSEGVLNIRKFSGYEIDCLLG